ncbi:hypothetical protein C8Q75DRAFT_812006 [Abortiporus biennis]|nr:hypothetical protein C8Q75DRAFT_812006 [Abortiporus biennis]
MAFSDAPRSETRDILVKKINSIETKLKDDVAAINAWLEAEIRALKDKAEGQIHSVTKHAKDQLVPLQRQWNMLIPISNLPPEILTEIFNIHKYSDGGLRSLLDLSQVCRHWHLIGLQTNSYWCHRHINDDCGPWPQEMQDRIGINSALSLELRLEYGTNYEKITQSLGQIRQHDRVRSINMVDMMLRSRLLSPPEVPGALKPLKQFLSNIEPFVEKLGIHITDYHTAHYYASSLSQFLSLSTRIFPHLTHLTLDRFYFDWDWLIFHNHIRHLTLTSLSYRLPELSDLYGILNRMCSLGTLVLDFRLPSYDAPGIWTMDDYLLPNVEDAAVELPCLEKLKVTGHLNNVAAVLGDIEIGPETKVHLSCHFDAADPLLLDEEAHIPPGFEYTKLLNHIAVNFEEFSSPTDRVRTLYLREVYPKIEDEFDPIGVEFVAYPRIVLPSNYGINDTQHVLFDLVKPILVIGLNADEDYLPNEQDYSSRLLVDLPTYIPLEFLEVLHLAGNLSIDIPGRFSTMTNLRILTVNGMRLIKNILPYLLPQTETSLLAAEQGHHNVAKGRGGREFDEEKVTQKRGKKRGKKVGTTNGKAKKGGKGKGVKSRETEGARSSPRTTIQSSKHLVLFPHLTTLVLHYDGKSRLGRAEKDRVETLLTLKDVIAQRRDLGMPLQELYLLDDLAKEKILIDGLVDVIGDTCIRMNWPPMSSTIILKEV